MVRQGLLLIHPAITTTPEEVEKVKASAVAKDIKFVDQFLINKVNEGSVKVEKDKYDVIQYLTPEAPEAILFPKKLVGTLSEGLKKDGVLYGLSDRYKLDALVNGFEIVHGEEYHWVKKQDSEVQVEAVAVPLKKSGTSKSSSLPSFKKASSGKALPSFKKAESKPLPSFKKETKETKLESKIQRVGSSDEDLDDDEDEENLFDASRMKYLDDGDDESLDEDELLDEEDAKNLGSITMITCGKSKTKKKKACKDCTCGIKEMEEEEIDNIRNQQDNIVKFTEEELTEIDFTIEGKKVGGCGSCSLGDAFRCTGCPYLGLPAFKPGQPINLNSITDDL
ncbi:Fe-S cluster assembly protein DRE2 [Nakaseomyces bracarensis]|uniref:Fe-S cluster assembly protein DRE2 n=1 Tax=Nakaseomyces bracarensis TaxID=273131 RepID=A0ABR4NRD1_9SACH